MFKDLKNNFFARYYDGGGLFAFIVRGAGGNLVINAIYMALMLGMTIMLARTLGPMEFGVYAYVVAFIGLLGAPLVIGFPILITRMTSEYKTKGDWGKARGFLRWSVSVGFLLVVTVCLVGLLLLPFHGRGFNDSMRNPVLFGLCMLPFLGMLSVCRGMLQGVGNVVIAQIGEKLVRPLLLWIFVGIVIATWGLGTLSAVNVLLVYVFATGGAAFTGGVIARAKWTAIAELPNPKYECRKWINSSMPLLIFGALDVLMHRIDILLVGAFWGAEQTGVYQTAVRAVELLALIAVILQMPLAPIISSIHVGEDNSQLQWIVTKSARLIFLLTVPVGLIGIFWAETIVMTAFGEDYLSASVPLKILCFGQIINVTIGPAAVLLNMTGYEKSSSYGLVVAALVNALFGLVMIPSLGIVGAATASALALVGWNIFLHLQALKKLSINTMPIILYNRKVSV